MKLKPLIRKAGDQSPYRGTFITRNNFVSALCNIMKQFLLGSENCVIHW